MMVGLLPALLLLTGAFDASPTPQTPPTTPSPSVTAKVNLTIAKDLGPIPFEYVDDHIAFQAEVGGERVWVLLDTGSSHNVIDAGLAKRLGLAIVPMQGVVHAVGGHDVPKNRVDDVSLVIPHALAGRLPMIALDLKPFSTAGHVVQAVIGQDLLTRFAVMVDKRAGQVVLAHGRASMTGGLDPIPVHLVGDRDRVVASVNGKPLTLTLDLGEAAGLALTPAAWARVKPSGAQVFERRTVGAGGGDMVPVSRLPTLTLGATTIPDVETRVGPEHPDDVDGRIGMGVLSRYSFILDVPQGRLWLIPVATDTSKLPAPVLSTP